MRKKSHISLAKFILDSNGMEELNSHKASFYMGSILPDCVPSFLTRKHCIEETFEILRKEICSLTENYDLSKGINTYYCRHLGIITHYVADYFTFPHNHIFLGSLAEHCRYEEDLKHKFRTYVKSEEAKKNRRQVSIYKTVDEILNFIKEKHKEYLNVIKKIEIDCHYIVELCFSVVDAILCYLEYRMEKQYT